MVFTLCALLLSIHLHAISLGFCLDSDFNKNMSDIGIGLKLELSGQHIAWKIVTAALKNHFDFKNIGNFTCKLLSFMLSLVA